MQVTKITILDGNLNSGINHDNDTSHYPNWRMINESSG